MKAQTLADAPPLVQALNTFGCEPQPGYEDGSWSSRCPAHDDRNPSLSINVGGDGRTLVCCHAGCDVENVLEALGLTFRDLFADAVDDDDVPIRYVYTDEEGSPLYAVVRGRGKNFYQMRWEDGGWEPGVRGVRRVPFRLSELLAGIAAGHPVYIVEGEKDVEHLTGLGQVATCNSGGAGKWRAEWSNWFQGAKVVILPDNDDPGRKHADSVAATLLEAAASVRVVTLPGLDAGGDVSDWLDAGGTVEALNVIVAETQEWAPSPEEATSSVTLGSTVSQDEAGYFIWTRNPDKNTEPEFVKKHISNFVLDPTAHITMGGESPRFILEVTLGDGRTEQLGQRELTSTQAFDRWCIDLKLQWSGLQRDLVGLRSLLLSKKDVPQLVGVDVVGLHGRTFVLPDEIIGERGVYAFVKPVVGDLWSGKTSFRRGFTWDTEAIEMLMKLHRSDVMTVILGWMAAAPLRSLCSEFPTLGMTGGSGRGKTTLLERVLKAFGYWTAPAHSLLGTTEHAINGRGASSNAFPVWTDEWRDSTGRPEAREAFKQLIRNAWNGASSSKGGGNRDNVSEVRSLPASAPLIVSGEDSFYEISHIERIVLIDIPKDGRDTAALKAFDGLSVAGFGRDYLTWLLDHMDGDDEWMVMPPRVYNRQLHGREIVRWGYGMLEQFLMACDIDTTSGFMPMFDDSLVKSGQDAAVTLRPIDEAVNLTLDLQDGRDRMISWQDTVKGEIWTRPLALSKWAKDHDLNLGGGARAVSAWLQSEYGATMSRHPLYGDAWHWKTP